MVPSLLVTLNVAGLTPGKVPLGRNNQHKIKLKTNEAVHGKNRLLTKTGQKGYIFLTKLRYTRFDLREIWFWKSKTNITMVETK